MLPDTALARISELLSAGNIMECLVVNKNWSFAFARAVFHSPGLESNDSVEFLFRLLSSPTYYPYAKFIQVLDIQPIASLNIYMGDLDSLIRQCTNLKLFKLQYCVHISNIILRSLSRCLQLEVLDLKGCPLSDSYFSQLTINCQKLKRV